MQIISAQERVVSQLTMFEEDTVVVAEEADKLDVHDPYAKTNENIIIDPAYLEPVISAIEAADVVAIDTETTGLDFIRDVMHGTSITTDDGGWYITGSALIPFMQELHTFTSDPNKLFVGHNLCYDFHFLGRYDCIPVKYFDTMIAQWLIDENQDLGLKSLAYTKLGVTGDIPEFKNMQRDVKKMRKLKKLSDVTIYDIPLDTLGAYAIKDTDYTLALYYKSVFELEEEEQTQIFWEQEMPFLMVLYEMEEAGMQLNIPELQRMQVEYGERIEKLYAQWNEMTGGVNPNSNKQLAEYLFKRLKLPKQGKTKSGQPSTDALVIQRLTPMDETGSLKVLTEIKALEKLKSTYVDALLVKSYNGRIHGSYRQHGARTGRLSSADPNLQNIPGQGEDGKRIRSTFIAKPGHVLIGCDYSQVELRFLAHDSKDEEGFLKVFKEGGDPHQSTCDMIVALGYNILRKHAKAVNFGWAYGMGSRTLANNIEKNTGERPAEKDAKAWLDGFDEAKPKLVSYRKVVIRRTRQLGYVRTVGGRRRRLPGINSPVNSFRFKAERQAVNTRIQGSCADMIKWAMNQLRPWCKLYGVEMIGQVHDEIVFEAPEEVAEEFVPIVQNIMESIEEHYNLIVPIEAEPAIGPNWAEIH